MRLDLRAVAKCVEVLGVTSSRSGLCKVLRMCTGFVRSIPGIPSVIIPSKVYGTFRPVLHGELLNADAVVVVRSNVPGLRSYRFKIEITFAHLSYSEILEMVLPASVPPPRSFQMVGKIVHVNLRDCQLEHMETIGDVLLKKVRGAGTVVTKTDRISNQHRTCDLKVIAGEESLCTMHREGGLTFFIEYGLVYWNSKLEHERSSVISDIREEDVLCDPFCGVGPLSIRAVVETGCRAFSNDVNPVAVRCFRRNLEINGIGEDRATCSNMDGAEFLEALRAKNVPITKFYFNLPGRGVEMIEHLRHFDGDATAFVYYFVRSDQDPVFVIESAYHGSPDKWRVRMARNVAPNKKMYVLIAKIASIFGEGNEAADSSLPAPPPTRPVSDLTES